VEVGAPYPNSVAQLQHNMHIQRGVPGVPVNQEDSNRYYMPKSLTYYDFFLESNLLKPYNLGNVYSLTGKGLELSTDKKI